MNNQARFSGRQTLTVAATVVSPPKAGWRFLSLSLPRATLRSTSFRYAGPGLNSSAGFAGSLNSSHLKLIWLGAICVILVFVSGCNRPATSGGPPAATGSSPEAISSSAEVVKVRAASISFPAGGKIDAAVLLSISSGFHVNANPATFSYLIATELTPGKAEGINAGPPSYPGAVKKKFQFAEQPLAVYEGDVLIKLPLRAEKNAANGPRSLPITIRVQACDHEKCFPPATVDAKISVEVK